MSDLTRRVPAPTPASNDGTSATAAHSPDVWEQLGNAFLNWQVAEENKPEVVLYMSLNSTTHHKTEIPEALAALDQAESEGLDKRHLLPISDPYWTGKTSTQDTYDHSLGKEGADKVQFWHDDPAMKEGEVRLNGGEPVMLGTENLDLKTPEGRQQLEDIRTNWDGVLQEMGMDDAYRAKVLTSLMGTTKDPQKIASGDGATNELLQYAMAMYRAEKGEFEVKSIVLSGHHWEEGRGDVYPGTGGVGSGQGIWGEDRDHNYESSSDDGLRPGGDFFSLKDVEALGAAFPKAYSQVESVQFSACNTHMLGMTDDTGKPLTTDQWLQSTFTNIERASYWEGLAPSAANGDWSNGEFLLDDLRADAGHASDWRTVSGKRNGASRMRRSELDGSGALTPIADTDVKVDGTNGYVKGKGRSLAAQDKPFWDVNAGDREHIYTAPDGEIGWSKEDQDLSDAWGEVLRGWMPSFF